VRRAGQGLLDRGLDGSRPVAILSDNSVDHALLALGAMHVGVPVAPVSPAYSLMSKDFAKLKAILRAAASGPGVGGRSREVRARACRGRREVDADRRAAPGESELQGGRSLRPASEPGTIAKILFTSGSTGTPKGVINTQRMLTVNQEQYARVWPFLEDRPQVLVDWLPWNHTFAATTISA